MFRLQPIALGGVGWVALFDPKLVGSFFDLSVSDSTLGIHRFHLDLPDDFFLGILAPACRASLRATATACLRLVTFFPLPDFSVPSLYSCITFSTLPLPLVAVFFAIANPFRGLDPGENQSVSARNG